MRSSNKPAVRLQDTVQVGRIETLEDVLRMLSSLQDLSPVQRKLYGITQQRLREVIQKPKVEQKGRIMP